MTSSPVVDLSVVQRFLETVLPAKGSKCVGTMVEGRFMNAWGANPTWVVGAAGKADGQGMDAYFALGGFDSARRRKQANVVAIRSFWLDIDTREGKPGERYVDRKEAVREVVRFADELGLPSPTLVSSGYGLHVYWPCTEDMAPASWNATASVLKRACVKWGLAVDPSRTTDEASVLRVPGTRNFKRSAHRRVKVVQWGQVDDHETIRRALEAYAGPAESDQLGDGPEHVHAAHCRDLSVRFDSDPSSAHVIAERCGVIRLVRDTRGNVDEPTWYGALGVIAKTTEGATVAHEWSKGHPQYSPCETDAKLTQLESVGPTTCARLRLLQPAVCAACHQTVKSPILLGRQRSAPGRPRPLSRRLSDVQACELRFAPQPFQRLLQDLSSGTPAPLDFVLSASLTAAGAVLGNRVWLNLKRRGRWLEAPNAWGMLVGGPSSRKSPSAKPIRQFLSNLERDRRPDFDAKMAVYRSELIAHEQMVSGIRTAAIAAVKKTPGQPPTLPPTPAEPQKPTSARYVTSDSSYEALGVLCRDNPSGILVFQDELSGFLGEMAKPERQAAKGFMLAGWHGAEAYTFDRVGRGSIVLDRYAVSVFGGIQPALLERLLIGGARSGDGADGMAQRFGLTVWPDTQSGSFVDQAYDEAAQAEAEGAFRFLADLDPVSVGAEYRRPGDPPSFDLDDDAYALFKAWCESWQLPLVDETNELDAYRQHVAKLPKVVATIAILIHVLEGGGSHVAGPTMLRATDATKYFASHARRIYSAVSRSGYEPARALARRISAGDIAGSFTARDAVRWGWAGIDTPQSARAALDVLEGAGWLTCNEKPAGSAGGRPTLVWAVCPGAEGAPWE